MKAALQVHPTRISDELLEREIYPVLQAQGYTYYLLPRRHEGRVELEPDTDLILSLGGDGTFLNGARVAYHHCLPILGVMLGRLGFLCFAEMAELPQALAEFASGQMAVEERCVLEALLIAPDGGTTHAIAINDVVIHRFDSDNVRDLVVHSDQQLIASYRADGIILATAAGSTAYTMAAGGPLVHPQMDLLVLTPICAHSLFTKPLILPSEHTVVVQGKSSHSPLLVMCDGGQRQRLEPASRLEVVIKPDSLQVLRPAGYDFFQVLRERFQHGYIYGEHNA